MMVDVEVDFRVHDVHHLFVDLDPKMNEQTRRRNDMKVLNIF